jgi:nickel superoxide dismutase
MTRRSLHILLALLVTMVSAGFASAHCEIPCGIYDDQMRVALISEHITTIEKAMKKISDLSGEKASDFNQRARWVMNKENHANELQHIVTQYFMTQRIKPDTKNYAEKLTVLHKMLVQAMKCKQTTDLSHVSALRALVKEFQGLYF